MAERANDGVGLALEALHISNFALGQKEGRENERVLYYYPEHTEDSLQTRNTGLASALVTFTCAPPLRRHARREDEGGYHHRQPQLPSERHEEAPPAQRGPGSMNRKMPFCYMDSC